MGPFLRLLITSCCAAIIAEERKKAKYCIIGAGPAGIQLGQYFMHAGVDYATFERGEGAGTFFAQYPIHRKLISINKRSTRSSSKEFNLRHDWNSLLDTKVTPFPEWTEEYYPHADTLVEYLRAVAAEQEGHVFYRHNVTDISRSKIEGDSGFDVMIEVPGGKKVQWHCGKVIVSTGLWKPNMPKGNWFRGLEKAIGYDDLVPWNGPQFQNLSVLILGNGNAAFETADAMRNWAAEIGIFGRRGERTAKDTHYVGDIRGHRLTSQDSLELKTLDDVFFSPEEIASKLELVECESPGPGRGQIGSGWPLGSLATDKELKGFRGNKPLCILSDYDKDEFLIADWDLENDDVADALGKWKDDMHQNRAPADWLKWHRNRVRQYGAELLDAAGQPDALSKSVFTMKKEKVRELVATSSEFRKALPGLLASTQGLWLAHASFRKPFDVVIRALGWKMEAEPLHSLNVQFDKKDKYPVTDACFRARNKDDGSTVDGLYFAGTITHGYDKLRFGSAGGFIHGFRYTTDTLFRCLMHEVEKKPLWEGSKHVFSWSPDMSCTSTAEGRQVCLKRVELTPEPKTGLARQSPAKRRAEIEQSPLWSHLMRRANEASGPYQMSCGALLDGIVYNKTAGTATYIENMPMDIFEDNFKDQPRLALVLRYGIGDSYDKLEPNFGAPSGLRSAVMAWVSKFLHPVFMFAQPSQALINSTRLHLAEDRWTDFAGREEVVAMLNFMKTVEAAAWSGTAPPQFHEQWDQIKMECTHHVEEEDDEVLEGIQSWAGGNVDVQAYKS